MPKSRTKNSKKRTLSTPDKVCDTPISKKQVRNENENMNATRNSANARPVNGIVKNTGIPVNVPNAMVFTPGQSLQYCAPNQQFNSPVQQPVQYTFQQSPVHGYQNMQQTFQENISAHGFADVQATLKRLELRIQTVDSKMEKLNDIESKISSMNQLITKFERRVSSVETKMTAVEKRMEEMEASRAYDSQLCDEAKEHCTRLEKDLKSEMKKCEVLTKELKEVKSENQKIKEDVIDGKARSMRDNLLFHGLKECDTFDQRKQENCLDKVLELCEVTLKIENAREMKIDRAHRLGPYSAGKTRPIVVKFNYYPDKMKIKQAAFTGLQGSNFRITDQFPREIQERRRILYPEFKRARDQGRSAVLSYDKLFIEGRLITADSITTIPSGTGSI